MREFTGKVLLLGNYLPDQQESMQRFAQIFLNELPKRGIQTELIRPEPVLGKFSTNKWFGYVDKFVFFPARLKNRVRSFNPNDVLHICDHSNAVYSPVGARFQRLITCHDLIAIRSALGEFPENPTRPAGRSYQKIILSGLQRARRVICVSETTRDDFLRITNVPGHRASVIHNGLNYTFDPMIPHAARQIISRRITPLPPRFILHVGGNQWYKNRVGVVSIYHELLKQNPTSPSLVLIGKPLPPEVQRQPKIHAVTKCDNQTLHAFYSQAHALLFPSLAEGFGWPIIEAQACGCPVATSNLAPMTEVGGASAIYFDPRDHSDAANKLRILLNESKDEHAIRIEAGRENARRFDPSRMIDRYVEEYSNLTA
jgi:glycosyltransferase involved in cell wall biosynthesis